MELDTRLALRRRRRATMAPVRMFRMEDRMNKKNEKKKMKKKKT
jgi:hypothetical protein